MVAETSNNKLLWRSTIFLALIGSAASVYIDTYLKGSWAFTEISSALWCVWLGMLASTRIRMPVWLRAIIICAFFALYFFTPRFDVMIGGINYHLVGLDALRFVLLFLLGIGIGPDLKQNNRFGENLALFIVFLCFYVFVKLVEQRSVYALEAQPVDILRNVADYGKIIPLAASVLYCVRLSLSDKVQNAISKKSVWITALVLILGLGLFDIIRPIVRYGFYLRPITEAITNPGVGILLILGIEKLAGRKAKNAAE